MARKLTALLLAVMASVASVAASPDDELQAMADAFDAVLTGMAYAGAGLCLFALVWAGFVLMAEGAEGENRGRTRNAVFMAVVGLVVVLMAKAIALLVSGGVIPSL
ncbi:MAG: TrbC/VirB2 family protein [Chloroflexota bacterium]|nr:TrbC/VirB2 family protein [Chloroflexota bacterium]MDE2683195.1 TrbC/VirB2 family protein [Chloroflexota bacterium]